MQIQNFSLHLPFVPNSHKCANCIYNSLCDANTQEGKPDVIITWFQIQASRISYCRRKQGTAAFQSRQYHHWRRIWVGKPSTWSRFRFSLRREFYYCVEWAPQTDSTQNTLEISIYRRLAGGSLAEAHRKAAMGRDRDRFLPQQRWKKLSIFGIWQRSPSGRCTLPYRWNRTSSSTGCHGGFYVQHLFFQCSERDKLLLPCSTPHLSCASRHQTLQSERPDFSDQSNRTARRE